MIEAILIIVCALVFVVVWAVGMAVMLSWAVKGAGDLGDLGKEVE